MYFIDVIRGKNITFVYHKILYNMKEEELIEQMKNGNNIAFAALYDYYCQKVYNFTKLYVTSSDTVAEIVQDVFVKFWEARHLLDNNKKVEGFLFVITRNIIFNKARSRMREDMFKMTILRSIENEEPYNQEDQMVAEDLKEYIDRLIPCYLKGNVRYS